MEFSHISVLYYETLDALMVQIPGIEPGRGLTLAGF